MCKWNPTTNNIEQDIKSKTFTLHLPKRFMNAVQVGLLIFVVLQGTGLLIKPKPKSLVLAFKHCSHL